MTEGIAKMFSSSHGYAFFVVIMLFNFKLQENVESDSIVRDPEIVSNDRQLR